MRNERKFPPGRVAWWAVAVFGFAAILSYTDRQILALLVDPLRHDLHISDSEFSVLQGAAFAVLYSILGLPLGRLADVLPRQRLLLGAVTVWSLGTAACGYADSFVQLFAARLMVGVGEAAFAPTAMSLIADYFPSARRAMAIGVFCTGMVIGTGAGIGIGGALLELAQRGAYVGIPALGSLAPWRSVLVLAGLSGAVILLMLLTLREPVTRKFEWRNLVAHFGFAEMVNPFRAQSALLLPLYAGMAACSIVDYSLLSWTPALLARRFAFSPGAIGSSLGAVAVMAGLLGTPAGGALTDWCTKRWGSRSRTKLVFVIALFGLLSAPVGILANSTQTLIAAACWMLVSAVIAVASIATVLDLLPTESRGFATSTIAFTNTIIGLGLGPTLVALTTDHLYGAASGLGRAITTVITAAILVACACYYVGFRRSKRAAPIGPADATARSSAHPFDQADGV
jgi:MFS family permease